MPGRGETRLDAGGRDVEVSKPKKELFPESGITKEALARYYLDVAGTALPHLRDRPVHMHRFPDGIEAEGFHHKEVPDHFPDWIKRVRLAKQEGGEIDQLVVSEPAALAYVADQGTITLHGWLSRADRPEHPDRMVFDLDPPDADFDHVRSAARTVRDVLEDLELNGFLTTTAPAGFTWSSPWIGAPASTRPASSRERSPGWRRPAIPRA